MHSGATDAPTNYISNQMRAFLLLAVRCNITSITHGRTSGWVSSGCIESHVGGGYCDDFGVSSMALEHLQSGYSVVGYFEPIEMFGDGDL